MNLPDCLAVDSDGEICVPGHRISLYNIVSLYLQGYSLGELVERLPTLDRSQIEGTIRFYHQNRDEVDAYVAEYRAEMDRLRALAPKGPSLEELRRRMDAKRQGQAS